MSKKVPYAALKRLSKEYDLDHVIMFATQGKTQWVTTYGNTLKACDEAAQFGNEMREKLGWPEHLKKEPSRVRKLQARIKELELQLEGAFPPSTKEIDGLSSISYYVPYGKYREFDLDKDVFPGIPLNITPVYILETEQWTFVWAFDVNREYVYEWDKVSEVYNSVKWRDRK